jgi:hypothetical protein
MTRPSAGAPSPRLVTGPIDLARWQRLTSHILLGGQPLESTLLKLEAERAAKEKADG